MPRMGSRDFTISQCIQPKRGGYYSKLGNYPDVYLCIKLAEILLLKPRNALVAALRAPGI